MPPTDPGRVRPAGPPPDAARPGATRRGDELPGPTTSGGDEDDTLDLALSVGPDPDAARWPPRTPDGTGLWAGSPDPGATRPLPTEPSAGVGGAGAWAGAWAGTGVGALLDDLPDWGPVRTPAGSFRLVPVVPEQDLPLISRWMNDPAVAAYWDLAGPPETTAPHVLGQLGGDGRSAPCLGVLDGRAMSYWEIYRADLDPLARYYPARPQDTGVHLLFGEVRDRGRGLGKALLRAVADHILDRRPACSRVVAEPDLRNTASVAAFLSAGFRFSAEVALPGKHAALMIRERRLRRTM